MRSPAAVMVSPSLAEAMSDGSVLMGTAVNANGEGCATTVRIGGHRGHRSCDCRAAR